MVTIFFTVKFWQPQLPVFYRKKYWFFITVCYWFLSFLVFMGLSAPSHTPVSHSLWFGTFGCRAVGSLLQQLSPHDAVFLVFTLLSCLLLSLRKLSFYLWCSWMFSPFVFVHNKWSQWLLTPMTSSWNTGVELKFLWHTYQSRYGDPITTRKELEWKSESGLTGTGHLNLYFHQSLWQTWGHSPTRWINSFG